MRAPGWEVRHAVEHRAARAQPVERRRRVVRPHDAHAPDAGPPGRRGEGRVEERAAGLAHRRPPVFEHEVVDEQVARAHHVGRHRGGSASNARATSATARGSSGADHTPPRFTDEPTMKPSARE